MWRCLVVLAVAVSAGCSVTGRVRVNPPVDHGQYVTQKIPGLGPVCAEVEFRHDF